MKKLLRITTSILLTVVGVGAIFFSGSALLRGVDWIVAIMCTSLIAIGIALVAIGWAIKSGENVKDMLRDLFSGISF